jgi:hypothetical protein
MNQLREMEQTMLTTNDTRLGRSLADGLHQRYSSWRRQSDAVQGAYEVWLDAEGARRELAYAGYLAALDQEQLAADSYRDELAWVERISR